MKKLFLIGTLLCVLCSCGSGNSKKSAAPANVHEGHEWVDLGLPSGLKWATCNVGASCPEEFGNYYAWGETSTKTEYFNSNSASKGCSWWGGIDGSSSLDAATANWGGNWHLPTKAEFQELIDNCEWTWTTKNGCNGYEVTGPNGKNIFLPAAGCRAGDALWYDGCDGYYWSSMPYESGTDDAYYLMFCDGSRRVDNNSRPIGCSVRPVLPALCQNAVPANVHEGHEWVDLGLPSCLKWATCNVGASAPGDYGNYYAWGEISTKESYTESNSVSSGKSWSDIGGDSSRDAARANWGGRWRMPAESEFQELIDNCDWARTTQDGQNGYKVTGPNGNSIFLPAAGNKIDDKMHDVDLNGCYWSSTYLDSDADLSFDEWEGQASLSHMDYAYHLEWIVANFGGESIGLGMGNVYSSRALGCSVRPVLED